MRNSNLIRSRILFTSIPDWLSSRVYVCILDGHLFSQLLLQFAFNAVYKASVTFMQIIVYCMLLPETAPLLQAGVQIMHRTRTLYEVKCWLYVSKIIIVFVKIG